MRNREWLPFLFCIGVLGLNWPLLAIVRVTLPYYLYGFWIFFIGFLAVISVLNQKGRQGKDV